MLTASQLEAFIGQSEDKVLVAGYGSLLSEHSRRTFSQINSVGLPAMINGWQRGWITRSIAEQQTYVGATQVTDASKQTQHSINAQLISLRFDKRFETREQDYKFTRLSPVDIELSDELAQNKRLLQVLHSRPIYICETLYQEHSHSSYPVNYSYINTCLMGCYKQAGIAGVHAFFKHTQHWDSGVFVDDMKTAAYPRATPIEDNLWDIKTLLKQYGA